MFKAIKSSSALAAFAMFASPAIANTNIADMTDAAIINRCAIMTVNNNIKLLEEPLVFDPQADGSLRSVVGEKVTTIKNDANGHLVISYSAPNVEESNAGSIITRTMTFTSNALNLEISLRKHNETRPYVSISTTGGDTYSPTMDSMLKESMRMYIENSYAKSLNLNTSCINVHVDMRTKARGTPKP